MGVVLLITLTPFSGLPGRQSWCFLRATVIPPLKPLAALRCICNLARIYQKCNHNHKQVLPQSNTQLGHHSWWVVWAECSQQSPQQERKHGYLKSICSSRLSIFMLSVSPTQFSRVLACWGSPECLEIHFKRGLVTSNDPQLSRSHAPKCWEGMLHGASAAWTCARVHNFVCIPADACVCKCWLASKPRGSASFHPPIPGLRRMGRHARFFYTNSGEPNPGRSSCSPSNHLTNWLWLKRMNEEQKIQRLTVSQLHKFKASLSDTVSSRLPQHTQ